MGLRSVIAASSLSAFVLGACGDTPGKLPIGETCGGDADCASGLCFEQTCLDPAADDDLDGLTNGFEVALTTDPGNADTDSDDKDDAAELDAGMNPRDADGDGLIDAVESSLADADQDCLVDELDARDKRPDGESSELVASLCPEEGVCAAEGAVLAVTCPEGPDAPVCDFRRVPSHEAEETACDGLDNDCDGLRDEGCGLVFEGLLGHWRLDGDGRDSGPFGDDGVVAGAVAAADRFGEAGRALRFAGVSDRVTVAATRHPLGEVEVTYTAWVRPDDGAAAGIVSFGEILENRGSALALGAGGCARYVGQGNDAASATACAPAGHWSFLAVVKVGRSVRFYLDGRLQEETTLAAGQDLRRTGLTLGASKQLASGVTVEPFRGVLDDVRLYGRALSEAELATLFGEGGWAPVGTAGHPAQSCRHARDAAGAADGATPVDVDGDGPLAAVTAWCDQTTDGGGWTLVWVYGFTEAGAFTSAGNAVTPIPSWPAELADVPVSTSAPADPGTPGALDWAAWAWLGRGFRIESALAGGFACEPEGEGGGSLATGVEGPVGCRVVGEDRCASALPDWVFFWELGPGLSADNLFLYFDGSTAENWPTHDPCGQNAPPEAAGAGVAGALYLR